MTITLEAPLRSARTDRAGRPSVRQFRPDIEGLRAVAVTAVVLSHLGLGFPGGFVGVDVFLVISGFLITRQLAGELTRENRISFRRFYARRARRILPAATVVIVGTTLAAWRWDSPLRVRSDATDALFSAFSGVNWRLADQGTDYFQVTAPPSPFQHFWSLAVEEQFYVVWPALLLLVSVAFGRRYGRRKAVVWALALIMVVSLALSVMTTASSTSWSYFGTQTRAWELAFGALLAVTVDVWTRMPPALASQLSWLGLGLILLTSLTYGASTSFPGVAVVLPVLGSAFVIAGGCPGWSRGGEVLLRQPPMQFVGRVSYSWYLVHWPVLTILPMAAGRALTTADRWLVLVSSLAIATVMFYVVEQPIRTRRFLVVMPRYGLALGLALILASVGTAVAVTRQTDIPGGGAASPAALGSTSDLEVITRAVEAGTMLRNLPANIAPPLARAAMDRPPTRGCLTGHEATNSPPDSECTSGDPRGTRTMVMIGDSHANAWWPAIDAFARTNHWKLVFYGKAACPPGISVHSIDPQTNRVYTACDQWRSNIFDRIQARHPDTVLISHELRTLDIDPTGITQTVRKLRSAGSHVILLQDTPNPLNVGSIPDCLAKYPKDVQRCSLPRAEATTRMEGMIQRRVEAIAAQRAGAVLLDPAEWFCTAQTCPAVVKNIVVYADTSHTTATYIRWIAPAVSVALAKLTG
jgi:peptidoglycan/LPS O-acetylase OafA/YrhL